MTRSLQFASPRERISIFSLEKQSNAKDLGSSFGTAYGRVLLIMNQGPNSCLVCFCRMGLWASCPGLKSWAAFLLEEPVYVAMMDRSSWTKKLGVLGWSKIGLGIHIGRNSQISLIRNSDYNLFFNSFIIFFFFFFEKNSFIITLHYCCNQHHRFTT